MTLGRQLALALAAAAFGSACGGGAVARRYDAVMAGNVAEGAAVELDGTVIEACTLRDGMAYFGYDEAALAALTPPVVARIAECMNEGRLVGRAVLVPRRDIADALEAHGVLPSRVFVSEADPQYSSPQFGDQRLAAASPPPSLGSLRRTQGTAQSPALADGAHRLRADHPLAGRCTQGDPEDAIREAHVVAR